MENFIFPKSFPHHSKTENFENKFLFPVASIGNQSMRINILFSYIVMNTRGRGEPMHHQPITISKGDPYASSSNAAASMETKGRTTQNHTNVNFF